MDIMMFFKPYKYKSFIFRLFEIFLGLLFITSAILKIVEINRFCIQIYAYGVITQKELLPWIATLTILIEISLGLLFLLSYPYRKLTLWFNLILLVTFTGLIIYGWLFNNLKDCGCFGKIEMGPVESIVKNLVIILITVFCLFGLQIIKIKIDIKHISRFYLPLIIVLCVTLFFCIYQLQQEQISTHDSSSKETSVYATMDIEIDGKKYDLSKGEYLVALFSFGCEHCADEAPKINKYMFLNALPPVIALCLEESQEEKEDFTSKVQPLFPIYSLGNKARLFFSLIDKEPPRLIYLKDGKIIKYWDYTLPTPEEILSELQKLR